MFYRVATVAGLEAGRETESVLAAAFGAMSRVAVEVTPSAAPRGKMMLYVLGHLGRLALSVVLRGMRPEDSQFRRA